MHERYNPVGHVAVLMSLSSTDIILDSKPQNRSLVFVDTSTLSPAAVVILGEKFKSKGCTYINAPVWGPPEGAMQGMGLNFVLFLG